MLVLETLSLHAFWSHDRVYWHHRFCKCYQLATRDNAVECLSTVVTIASVLLPLNRLINSTLVPLSARKITVSCLAVRFGV